MLSTYEEEEAFFDSQDHLTMADSDIGRDETIDFLHGVWVSEPQSVKERRELFSSRMGFSEHSDRFESSEAHLGHFDQSTSSSSCDNLLFERRESNSEADCSVNHSDVDWLDDVDGQIDENLGSGNQTWAACVRESSPRVEKMSKTAIKWWRHFARRKTKKSPANNPSQKMMSVEQNSKRCMELTAVYSGQRIKAHDGLILTMKFSPDGKYLASAGEDGVVCIWRVGMLEDKCSFNRNSYAPRMKKSSRSSVVVPEKTLHIEEEPLHKFYGHTSDVLDLSWSRSNHLLSSSMDSTVRLWQVGSDECLGVFRHVNYVTCVQFNPMDENYFISGSIDGKVRIWGIVNERVEDWADVKEIVTSVCYRPNGKGFIVGSFSGNCRFFESSGEGIILNAEISIKGKNKSSLNRITSIQFVESDSQRVMITSDDSKIRILDGVEVVRKYKGMAKSAGQMSASLAPGGKHILSLGEDSRLYLFNHDDLPIKVQPSKKPKSVRSCEHFFPEGGVTVALPWSHSDAAMSACNYRECSSKARDSARFSLASWFSMDGFSRAGALTWPEEKLPMCDVIACAEEEEENEGQLLRGVGPSTWGLVFVTGNFDGTIRTFRNYGLPVGL